MITFDYINYKGIHYDKTEYHNELGWLITAYCYDKKEMRSFALKDMSNIKHIRI